MPPTAPPLAPLAQYVRAIIEAWLDDTDLNAAELARRADLTPTAISDIRAGKRGIGLEVLVKLAEATGFSIDDALREAKTWRPGTRPKVTFDSDGRVRDGKPRFANLEGWAASEALARRKFRHIPEEAWRAARNASGAATPEMVTPEWIGQLASVFAMALRGEGEDVDPD